MEHPFEVGKTYRNRNGEYVVVNLDGPRMVIRYTDGSVLPTTVDIQARIWLNIVAEAQAQREMQRTESQPALKRRGGLRGLDFQGLQDHDFQEGVGGTCWRARSNLGGRLAQRLTDSTPHFFQSFDVYRRSEVHIVQPEHYEKKTKLQKAKFVFALAATHAWYGFYIEKNSGPMDKTWHWPNMVAALSTNAQLHEPVERAMGEYNLRWQVYVWGEGGRLAEVTSCPEGLLWQQDRIRPDVISWSDFMQRLDSIEAWVDLFLITRTSKAQALSAGTSIVDPVVATFRALLPLYKTSTLQLA